MLDIPFDEILEVLTHTLISNHIKASSITKALELIGTAASFEFGLLYEAEPSGALRLNEGSIVHPDTSSPLTIIKELSPQNYIVTSQKTTSYLVREPGNPPLVMQFLDLYSANSMILTPIPDENDSVCGLILLYSETALRTFDKADRNVLSAALSMLVHHVEVRMYQKKLNQAQLTLEGILDNAGIDIYVNDFYSHDILYANKSMAAPYGGKEAFTGQKCFQVLFPGQTGPCEFCPQNKLIDEQGLPTKVYSWDYMRPFDGSWFRVFSAAFRCIEGRLAHVVCSADITDNKLNEALIESLANFDQLTKLPNRRMLVKECKRSIDNATSNEQGYILFFDIDNFKQINDTYGHDAGDEFLILLGEFFTSIPLLKDSIYRNGGDEFVAIIGGESITKANIKSLANFIHKRFKKPWVLKKGDVLCNTSIGVACYPEDGITAEALLQKADSAMYQVKKSGGGGLCFGYELKDERTQKELPNGSDA